MKTTLAVLALNEIEAIRIVLPQIRREWVDEIIVVDGGSTDGTIEWCESHGFRVLRQKRRGYGAGMREVIEVASGDVIIEFMADGNCDPAGIPKLIQKMAEGYDLVIGSRYVDGATSADDTWVTRLGNWGFTRLVNLLFGASYADAMMGFRAYSIAAFQTLELDEDGLTFPTQGSIQFAKYGYRIAEVGVSEPKRIGGARKAHNFYTGLALLKMIARERVRPVRVPATSFAGTAGRQPLPGTWSASTISQARSSASSVPALEAAPLTTTAEKPVLFNIQER